MVAGASCDINNLNLWIVDKVYDVVVSAATEFLLKFFISFFYKVAGSYYLVFVGASLKA